MKPSVALAALTAAVAIAVAVHPGVARGAEATHQKPKAAASVHFGYPSADATVFAIDMVIEKCVPGSYFMACGWNTGYFGVQELGDQRHVAIFSVWDPTQGDDPSAVKPEERVELLHSDQGVRIKRFGGEGTGGQCMTDFAWKIGETNRFAVTARIDGNKTAYAGHLWIPSEQRWRHLVTFRTRTGGKPLRGLYSFVEDFRRDGRSALEARRARFLNGWVKPVAGDWTALAKARFTASNAEWEAKDTINAGLHENAAFFLETGAPVKNQVPLRTVLELPAPADGSPRRVPADLPQP